MDREETHRLFWKYNRQNPVVPNGDSATNQDGGHDDGNDDYDDDCDRQQQSRRRRRDSIPSASEMHRRMTLRRNIRVETLNQRVLHKHGGLKDTGRNICYVLRDRECHASSHLVKRREVVMQQHPQHHVRQQQNPQQHHHHSIKGLPVKSPKSAVEMISNLALNERNKKQRRIEVPLDRNGANQSSASRNTMSASTRQNDDGDDLIATDRSSNSSVDDNNMQERQDGPRQQSDSAMSQPPEKPTTMPSSIATEANGNRTKVNSRNATKSALANNGELLRRVSYPMKLWKEVRMFGEYHSVTKYHSTYFNHLGGNDTSAVSTISIAFSPDSKTMASTHGDHTVKITCCATGRLLETLVGHPRTPWTVKFHPTNPNILASGCLGHKVILWNWKAEGNKYINFVFLHSAIISLSFHPEGNILAIANGQHIHFWGFSQQRLEEKGRLSGKNSNFNHNGTQQQQPYTRPDGILTKTDQRHMLRCVHFLPDGKSLIVGGVNRRTNEEMPQLGGMSGGGMSFYLRLCDFDASVALSPPRTHPGNNTNRRRIISNSRMIVPRVLLYNDGGFDVSPDGKTLCACAEYWLPNGVNNAMELLQMEEREHLTDDDYDDDVVDGDNDDGAENNRDEANSQMPAANGTNNGNDDASLPSAEIAARSALSPPRANSNARISISSNDAPVQRGAPLTPRTPPPGRSRIALSPPSPPGRRFANGLARRQQQQQQQQQQMQQSHQQSHHHDNRQLQQSLQEQQRAQNAGRGNGRTGYAVPPPPPPSATGGGGSHRLPHPLSMISTMHHNNNHLTSSEMPPPHQNGRYVPHVVTISLDTAPIVQANGETWSPGRSGKLSAVARGYRPRLGQLLEACPLDGKKSTAVTCVKFSPSTDFCLIGYGIRDTVSSNGHGPYHPVTALYRIKGGMTHVSTMLSEDDDVNIARFHPDPGYGLVYGTKQGRVRVLGPRPWNYYNL